jgi:hypothetical protein
MAKLSDLIDVKMSADTITVQGTKIPVHLGFSAFEYIAEAYGGSYHKFENELNLMLKRGNVVLDAHTTKLMRALVYGLVRAGGTETTPQELEQAIPLQDVPEVFNTVLDIFARQNFDQKDSAKIVTPKTNGGRNKRKHKGKKR